MARPAPFPPPIYTRRGKAFVRLRPAPGQVQDITLGPAGSEEAEREYARIVAELAVSRNKPIVAAGPGLLLSSLVLTHFQWAETRYEARQLGRIKKALTPAVRLYGHRAAAEFGPLALETVRAELVREGYCRRLCNQMVDCIRWMFRRAAGQELVPESVSRALYTLPAIHKGEAVAGIVPTDHPRIPSVAGEIVEATLPYLGAIVGDMVRLQRLTGLRPGEVCVLRPSDVERPWKTIEGIDLWLYHLDGRHKTDWRGHQRQVPLGPQAQALLLPYLEREASAYCFSPAEARKAWEQGKRTARKSKLTPSQTKRKRKKKPKKQPGQRYTTQSYGRAIVAACERGSLPRWAPNQIRHEVLERIEAEHSQEDARCVAGHMTPSTTSIYSQGVLRAAQVMAKTG